MMFIKLSIAVFLLRLAPHNLYRYILHASILIVSIWSIVLFFWNLFQCHPVEAQWDYRILADDKTAFCVPADEVVAAAYSLSVMTILSDWLYALIPIPMVWHVKMTKQAKTTVVLVLGLGIFASVATLIRLKFLADLTQLDDLLCKLLWILYESRQDKLTNKSRHDRYDDLDNSRAWRRHCCRESHHDPTAAPCLEGQRVR